ncbi:MAG: DUF5700 domain-containing putative Zn-dependent protease [Gemmatimonadales bacterium]
MPETRIALRVDSSEAIAVLSVLTEERAGHAADSAAWAAVFESTPYRRLEAREAAMGRSFTRDTFAAFVRSDSLRARAEALRTTLSAWSRVDFDQAARRVLAYLPSDATIRATIFPMIKPQPNSFVFDPRNDPAIFLYLDPAVTPAKFLNTVAHELYHIGYASVGETGPAPGESLTPEARRAIEWMGALGEGYAMLAAAGSPDVHPHAASDSADRARWDRDLDRVDDGLAEVEAFLLDLAEGRIATEEDERRRAFGFFGIQGPWYTVGYRMAVAIEREFGRPALIEAMSDPRVAVRRFNEAVAAENARTGATRRMWSAELLEAIGAT